MDHHVRDVEETALFLQKHLPWSPQVCLMLGTGLGGVVKAMDVVWSSAYGDIPHFPVSTAPEHAGRLLVGKVGNIRVALFQGRFHYYEGYSARELALPVRVMARLGVRCLIGCNAAGGLNLGFAAGDLMLIRDHINLIPDNPLRGPNADAWGPRFPDLSRVYSAEMRAALLDLSRRLAITLREGVFVAVPGPSLETPAETRYLRMIGADAVAMSLVPEVIAAAHSGMKVVGVSVIANVNDPDNFRPIRIEEVVDQAKRAQGRLERLLMAFLEEPSQWKDAIS